ncbi:P44/Msp2 family outer membrane protein [Ehrlichia ruminantium]|nr:P44/Msp2 family outer membrane protein [Ehrlichia ruminantium]AAA98610.1 major antigenic surface protein [Ehrlichia ruminantium]AAR10945.1 MAP1 [Ehrlichia ruminantium]QLK55560.1 P44/Msp2 family outer membrane protein [Ehrlichia ruminantium]QLK56476.1 P44/Msp2 family outer membrane protein [Ehrlichia ruminantium]UOD99673.1 P44/Msp2 family outer membrane protein [Ehrlichia ruminantium]
MNCKKIFITSTLISLVSFLPGVSFSDVIQEDSNPAGSVYISAKYMPTASHFGKMSIKEDSKNTQTVFGLKKDWDGVKVPTSENTNYSSLFTEKDYSFRYENNPFLGFAGAIGYSMNGPRIEFEVSYETFDVKNPGGNYKNDAHMYCALDTAQQSATNGATLASSVMIKNENLTNISLMLNACYDIMLDGMPVSPYVCAGIGTDLVSVINATNPKLSYQGKLGISYSINSEASIFIGGHFHRVIGNEFKDIATLKIFTATNKVSTVANPGFASATLDVCHFGIEIGGRFIF